MWNVEVSRISRTRRKENKEERKVAKHLWPAGGDAEHFEALLPVGQRVHSLFPFGEVLSNNNINIYHLWT